MYIYTNKAILIYMDRMFEAKASRCPSGVHAKQMMFYLRSVVIKRWQRWSERKEQEVVSNGSAPGIVTTKTILFFLSSRLFPRETSYSRFIPTATGLQSRLTFFLSMRAHRALKRDIHSEFGIWYPVWKSTQSSVNN